MQPTKPFHRKPAGKRHLTKGLYRWHRRIGVSAALFLLWLVISGLLLNHTEHLDLDKRKLHSAALAHWYHLDTNSPQVYYPLGSHWVAETQEAILLDGAPLASASTHAKLIGTAQIPPLFAVATDKELLLLSEQGQLIDRLAADTLPISPITQIGQACGGITLTNGQKQFVTLDGLDWQDCTEQLTATPVKQLNATQLDQLVPGVSLEKIILDLHTGHFFGTLGVWFVDMIALCLSLLALSGLWLFVKMGKKNHRNHNT